MDRIAGFAFWTFIFLVRMTYKDYIAKSPEAENVDREQLNPTPPFPLVPEKRLEYVVNGRKIPCAFERYYYIKLNIALPIIRIEPEIIERHYQRRLQEDKLDISTLNDVEAANSFFIDRLSYLSNLN